MKARLRMLQHAQRVSGNVSQTCRFFGVSRALFYIWKKRYEKNGLAGLRDQASEATPNPVSYSAGDRFLDSPDSRRAALWGCSNQAVPSAALSCVRLTDHHPEDLSSPSRWPNFFEEVSPRPQACRRSALGSRPVCAAVKFVPRVGRARQRFYQFTAIDEATRFRVLRVYDHNNTKTAMEFLHEVREHLPFAIRTIQTDNDSSFGPQFTWHLSDLRISHRHIPPGCPEVPQD